MTIENENTVKGKSKDISSESAVRFADKHQILFLLVRGLNSEKFKNLSSAYSSVAEHWTSIFTPSESIQVSRVRSSLSVFTAKQVKLMQSMDSMALVPTRPMERSRPTITEGPPERLSHVEIERGQGSSQSYWLFHFHFHTSHVTMARPERVVTLC